MFAWLVLVRSKSSLQRNISLYSLYALYLPAILLSIHVFSIALRRIPSIIVYYIPLHSRIILSTTYHYTVDLRIKNGATSVTTRCVHFDDSVAIMITFGLCYNERQYIYRIFMLVHRVVCVYMLYLYRYMKTSMLNYFCKRALVDLHINPFC